MSSSYLGSERIALPAVRGQVFSHRDVRVGSDSDLSGCLRHDRFTPRSRHAGSPSDVALCHSRTHGPQQDHLRLHHHRPTSHQFKAAV